MIHRHLTITVATLLAAAAVWAQAPMTNDDLIKLAKAGLSEEFIVASVDEQGSQLMTDVNDLIELKGGGVSERVLREAMKKSPSQEPLSSDAVRRLVQSGFSEDFVADLIRTRPGQFATDASTIADLKQAGVSERLLSMMTKDASGRELPTGTQIRVRLIDSIDSRTNREGDRFRASLEEPVRLGGDVVIPKGADALVRLIADQSSGKLTGRAELTLRLDEITVNGKRMVINSSAVSEYSKSQGKNTGEKAAAVGAFGAIIGALAGGGKGAAIGAVTGAGAGAGSGVFMKGQRVRVPSETILTFQTEGSLKVP